MSNQARTWRFAPTCQGPMPRPVEWIDIESALGEPQFTSHPDDRSLCGSGIFSGSLQVAAGPAEDAAWTVRLSFQMSVVQLPAVCGARCCLV
jgi:hypothetical protein